MSRVRVIYYGQPPAFPPTDQHPDAKRVQTMIDDQPAWIDYVGELEPAAKEVADQRSGEWAKAAPVDEGAR
jgi:hypothetical protein